MWLTLHQLVSCANLWHTCCQRHLWPLEAGRRHVRLSFRCGKILELFYLRLKHEYQHKPLPLGTQKLSMGQCGTFANLRALAGDLTKLTYPWVSTQSPGATVCNHRQEKDGGGCYQLMCRQCQTVNMPAWINTDHMLLCDLQVFII